MPAFKQENLCKSVKSVGKKLHSVKYPTDCTDFHICSSVNICMPAFKQENLCKSVKSVGKKLHSVKFPTDCTDFHRCFLLTYASLRSSKRICVNLRNLWAKTPQRKVSHRLHRFPQMFSDNIRKSAFKQEILCKSVRSVGNSYRFPPRLMASSRLLCGPIEASLESLSVCKENSTFATDDG